MRYLLDTNICIYLFADAFPALNERVAGLVAGSLVVSMISYAELVYGTHNGKPPERAVLEGFLEEVELLPFDRAAADAYARMPFRRGSFDRLIGAHALSLGLPLVSRNAGDFADVPELKVENWTIAV